VPTFNDPAATRSIDDPRQIYAVLGTLSAAAASLEQSLHQLAAFHDGPARERRLATGDVRTGRAAAHQVSWELHRAGEIVHQIAASLDRAHEVEATIAYDHRDFPALAEAARPSADRGLGL